MAEQEHRCDMSTMEGGHGPAIGSCWEEDGHFWVSNGEYASQVNFCPFCGLEAPLAAEPWVAPPPTYGWMIDRQGRRYWGLLNPEPWNAGSVPAESAT